MSQEKDMLKASLLTCNQRVGKLRQSVSKTQGLFLLTIERLQALTDDEDESSRDKALLMEKLGAIQSATEFGTAALLRNKFAHHYPDQSRARVERLNLIIGESEFVIAAFESIEAYLLRKGFAP